MEAQLYFENNELYKDNRKFIDSWLDRAKRILFSSVQKRNWNGKQDKLISLIFGNKYFSYDLLA